MNEISDLGLVYTKAGLIVKGINCIEKLEKLKINFLPINEEGVAICDAHINRLTKVISKIETLTDGVLENEKEGFVHKLDSAKEYLRLNDVMIR